MTAEDQYNQRMAARKLAAEKIIKTPMYYKVCEGCESIVVEPVVMCVSCKAYRFDSDADRVIKVAKELSSRDQNTILEYDLYN
jgi:hypothetical protein